MKKLFALLLTLSLVLSLAACGGKEEAAPETEEPQIEEPAAPETPETEEPVAPEAETPEVEPEAEKPAETPEVKPEAEKPAKTPEVKPEAEKPAKTPEVKPEAEKPAETPEVKPEAAKSVDLTAFYGQLSEKYHFYDMETTDMGALSEEESAQAQAMMNLAGDPEILENYFPGIGALNCKQVIANTSAISAIAGEVVLVEAADEGGAQAVKDILNARVAYQVGDETTPGGAWYPDTIAQWEKNNRVVQNGRYLMLAVMENADEIVSSFNALFA